MAVHRPGASQLSPQLRASSPSCAVCFKLLSADPAPVNRLLIALGAGNRNEAMACTVVTFVVMMANAENDLQQRAPHLT